MVYCNHSSLVTLVSDAKYIHFYPTIQLLQPFHILTINKINFAYFATNTGLVICQQYNNWFIIKFEEVYTVQACLKTEVGCLYQHTCIAWCLGRNGKLLKFLSILIATVYFKDRNRISKTGHCISCSMVCKIIFCSEFLNIPDKAGRKTSLHIAKQSVMRFTQMQQRIVYQCKGHHLLKTNINTFVVIFIFRRLIDVKRLQAFVNSEVSAWVPQTKINTWNWALKAIFTFKSLFWHEK